MKNRKEKPRKTRSQGPLSSRSNRERDLQQDEDSISNPQERSSFLSSITDIRSHISRSTQSGFVAKAAKITRDNPLNDSFTAILLTAFEYVSNDLRKKSKYFSMAVTTVFLTVSFIAFLDQITGLAPINALKTGIHLAGDFDLYITANPPSMKQVPVHTKNYYTDELEFFNAEYMTDLNKHRQKTQHSLLSSLPFVDFRAIDNTLQEAYAKYGTEP